MSWIDVYLAFWPELRRRAPDLPLQGGFRRPSDQDARNYCGTAVHGVYCHLLFRGVGRERMLAAEWFSLDPTTPRWAALRGVERVEPLPFLALAEPLPLILQDAGEGFERLYTPVAGPMSESEALAELSPLAAAGEIAYRTLLRAL